MSAYVLTRQDDTVAVWQKYDDPEKILEATDVIFVDDDDNNSLVDKLNAFHAASDPKYLSFPRLFKRFVFRHDGIQVLLEPRFQVDPCELRNPEICKDFCSYIEQNGSYFYGDHPSEKRFYHQPQDKFSGNKKQLNAHGIYVRPVKKILEYNPKLAAKQLKISSKPKGKKQNFIAREDILDFCYRLENIACYQDYFYLQRGHYFSRSKKDLCNYALCLIGLIEKMIIPAKCWRQLEIFQNIRCHWQKTATKDQFSRSFQKFMDSEVRKRKPKKIVLYGRDVVKKINPKFFKLYYGE